MKLTTKELIQQFEREHGTGRIWTGNEIARRYCDAYSEELIEAIEEDIDTSPLVAEIYDRINKEYY